MELLIMFRHTLAALKLKEEELCIFTYFLEDLMKQSGHGCSQVGLLNVATVQSWIASQQEPILDNFLGGKGAPEGGARGRERKKGRGFHSTFHLQDWL